MSDPLYVFQTTSYVFDKSDIGRSPEPNNIFTCIFPKPHSSSDDQRLHTLDMRKALTFCLDRTVSPCLFVSYADRMKDQTASAQIIFKRITACITPAYEVVNLRLLERLLAHSTKAQAIFVACLWYVSILDIYRAALWSSIHNFTLHYVITTASRSDTSFGKTVLHSLYR